MHSTTTQDVGRRGESVAADYLTRNGYEIIERNWRCPRGEIDIVARDNETVVFVEVKTRRGLGYGHPFEAVTAAKAARIRVLAGRWCQQACPRPRRIRIDVIAVVMPDRAEPRIEHLKRVC